MRYITRIALFLAAAASVGAQTPAASASDKATHRFEAGAGKFLLDGEPFVVKAAELHYPRIPRPYWEDRILKCKALGMNTICLYVFWNAHEQQPDKFDFTGQNDLRHFIKLCQKNDMKVILRPGPYVCAEWEMGGLPWWLLKKEDIRLREQDPYFMERVDKFQKSVVEQVGDLTVDKGGPIIMVQVENEYGSYGTDKPYIAAVRDMLRRNFGPDVALFQCDWSSNFLNNGLDDLIWTINFGTGADIDEQFAPLKEARPDAPLMCSEYWSGWFDKWGAGHETRPADEMIKGIDDMLSRGISFSLYMTHGGTNWGHWAGANSPGYAPDVTSYDYDAPISESGRLTPKYHQLRDVLARYADGKPLPEAPAEMPTMAIDEFTLTEVAPLFAGLPEWKEVENVSPMEMFDQGFGSILYRTTLPEDTDSALLTVEEPHDYALIYLDGLEIGSLDRRKGEKQLMIPPVKEGTMLDILVEATGRINFGRAIKDYKGITDRVSLSGTEDGHPYTRELKGWRVFNLEDKPEFYDSMEYFPIDVFTPEEGDRFPSGTYRGTFSLDSVADTFLDFSTWGKGLVYVNGHPMGRIWEIGPQQTLYMPGCRLRKGENEIMVFDILGPMKASVAGRTEPVLDRLNLPDSPSGERREIDLTAMQTAVEKQLKPGNGWQTVMFAAPSNARFVCLEAESVFDADGEAAIAEFYLLDEKGKRIEREDWKPRFATSENLTGNHTAEKSFDQQESTYWSSVPGEKMPQRLLIDLGADRTITGVELLPRVEPGAPGAIKNLRLHTSLTDPTK